MDLKDLMVVSLLVVVVLLKSLWFDQKNWFKMAVGGWFWFPVNGPAVGSRSGWKERANDGGRIGSGGGCQLAADGSDWLAVCGCLCVFPLAMVASLWVFGWERVSTEKKKSSGIRQRQVLLIAIKWCSEEEKIGIRVSLIIEESRGVSELHDKVSNKFWNYKPWT